MLQNISSKFSDFKWTSWIGCKHCNGDDAPESEVGKFYRDSPGKTRIFPNVPTSAAKRQFRWVCERWDFYTLLLVLFTSALGFDSENKKFWLLDICFGALLNKIYMELLLGTLFFFPFRLSFRDSTGFTIDVTNSNLATFRLTMLFLQVNLRSYAFHFEQTNHQPTNLNLDVTCLSTTGSYTGWNKRLKRYLCRIKVFCYQFSILFYTWQRNDMQIFLLLFLSWVWM